MPNPTISMSKDLQARIDAQLRGTDTRSEWMREAARQRLAREASEGSEVKSEPGTA